MLIKFFLFVTKNQPDILVGIVAILCIIACIRSVGALLDTEWQTKKSQRTTLILLAVMVICSALGFLWMYLVAPTPAGFDFAAPALLFALNLYVQSKSEDDCEVTTLQPETLSSKNKITQIQAA